MPGCRLRSRAIALVGLAAVPAATEVRPFRLRPNRSRAGLKTDAPLEAVPQLLFLTDLTFVRQ